MLPPTLRAADPFDLPEWLGVEEVTWEAAGGLRAGHRVAGWLGTDAHAPLDCDLLAVDEAFPAPVTDDASRLAAHQAWRHGQVLLAEYDARLVLAVPASVFDAETALEALRRLALAVGADPRRYAVKLRLGRDAAG